MAVAVEDGENPLVMQEDTGYGWNARRPLYETDGFSNFTYAVPPEVWLSNDLTARGRGARGHH